MFKLNKINVYMVLLIVPFFLSAENTLFKQWGEIISAIEVEDKELLESHCSGIMLKRFQSLSSLKGQQRYFKNMKFKVIKEFAGKDDKTRYLILEAFNRRRTEVFILEGSKWKWDHGISQEIKGPEDIDRVLNMRKCQALILQMKGIGTKVAFYFSDFEKKFIPHYSKMGIKKEDLVLTSPEDKSQIKLLLVEGYKYSADPTNICGITESPIFGYHYVILEDGSVGQMSVKQFKSFANELGLINDGKGKLKERKKFKAN